MKLSNQNIYNLRGCKNWGGDGAKCLWEGANNFWGCAPPRKSVPEVNRQRYHCYYIVLSGEIFMIWVDQHKQNLTVDA